MFEMTDQAAPQSEGRKLRIIKTAAEIVAMTVLGAAAFFVVAMAVIGAVVLFFALASYANM